LRIEKIRNEELHAFRVIRGSWVVMRMRGRWRRRRWAGLGRGVVADMRIACRLLVLRLTEINCLRDLG
jgi:hypothetical protein